MRVRSASEYWVARDGNDPTMDAPLSLAERMPEPECPAVVHAAVCVLRPGGEPWHELIRACSAKWAREPIAREFTGSDWALLMEAATFYAALWDDGLTKVARTPRLRQAKFGTTPEDRARLRIQFANADYAADRRGHTDIGSRAPRPHPGAEC